MRSELKAPIIYNRIKDTYQYDRNCNINFIHNEKKNILIGDKSKKVFKVGDKIKVKLQSAFPSERKIDFVLVK